MLTTPLTRILLLVLVASGCYSPSLEPCAVTCSSSSACPDDLTCGTDGYCHADGDTTSCVTETLHEVTITVSGTGVGQVTSDVGGLSCLPLCTAQIAAGTRVTLTASPASASRFTGWNGGVCSGMQSCSFTVGGPVQIGAGFNASLPLNLTVGGNGGGTVTSVPGGITCTDDCVGQFEDGTAVTLSAVPDGTSRLGAWGQACAGSTGASCGVTVNAATNVGIDFIRTAAVSVTPTGSGTGTVGSMPSGISCPGTCTQRYDVGATVTLTAAATGTSVFREWATGGACAGSTDPVCTFVLAADTTAIPTFIARRLVTVVVVGTEGAITGDVPCTAATDPCALMFDVGASITLGTVGTTKWRFGSWSTPPCTVTAGTCAFTVPNTDVTATATFIAQHDLVTQVSGSGGSVVVTPPGMACIAPCTTTYDVNTSVSLVANADLGYRFLDWQGSCAGQLAATCTLTMTGERTATARFLAIHTLSVMVNGPGTVSGAGGNATVSCATGATCTAEVDTNTTFPLTLTPGPGARMVSAIGCTGSPICNVVMDMARTVTVTFAGGKLVWSKQYGGTPPNGREAIEDVEVDAMQRVTVAGNISGGTSMNFGPGFTRAAGLTQRSILVARYSATGMVEWAHVIDPIIGSNDAYASANVIALGANGDVLIGGTFQGVITIPGQTAVGSAGGFDGFVLRIDNTGTLSGFQAIGGTGDESVADLAVTPAGNLHMLVRATAGSSFSIGTGPGTPVSFLGGTADIVASVGPAFVHRWAKILTPTNANTKTTRLLLASNADPILAGFYGGAPTPDFGGGPLAAGMRETGFLVRLLDATGAHVWSNDYGGSSPGGQLNNTRMVDAQLAPTGELTVVGWFDSNGAATEDVSGVAPSSFPLTRQGQNDMFVARYSAVDGSHLSSFRFGSANTVAGTSEIPVGLAIEAGGDLSITGLFTSPSMTIGPETINHLGSNDVFVLKMSNAGVGRWIRRLGGSVDERVSAIEVSSTGAVVFGGTYFGDHGAAPRTCTLDGVDFNGEDEGYVIVLSP